MPGIVIERRGGTELYLALNKGGVFKFFRDGKLVAPIRSSPLLVDGRASERNAVAHLVGEYDVEFSEDHIASAAASSAGRRRSR